MRLSQKISQLGTLEKIVATGGVLIGAAAIVGAGAFATFTSTGQATVSADAGELKVAMSQTFTIDNMAPGDTVYKLLPIVLPTTGSAGNLVSALGVFLDTTADTVGTAPDVIGQGKSLNGGTDGLTYVIKTCDEAWTPVVSPSPTDAPFACAGTVTETSTGVASHKLSSLEGVANSVEFLPSDFGVSANAGTGTFITDVDDVPLYSMIVFELPTTANNDYQKAAWSFDLTVTAVQRDATKS